MHEMSIAEGIIDIVERTAKQAGISRVKSVRISVGKLAGVDIPSLQFAWESVTRGGPAEGAALDIERPEGEAWCFDCSKNVPLKQFGEPCPFCGGYRLQPTGGTEMRVIDFVPADDDDAGQS
jgi:hydrogenase nickel incorporation protein HypA/HybF